MDQKISSEAGIVTSVILIVVGIIILPLAIGLLGSYPHELWPLGLVLLGCSGMILYGAIKTLRSSSKKLKGTDKQILQIKKNAHAKTPLLISATSGNPGTAPAIPALEEEVFVQWNYTKEEWKRFYNWERKERKWNNVIVSLLIALLSTLLLKGSRDATWFAAIAFSSAVAIIYGFISYRLAMASIGNSGKSNSIIITHRSVLINDKLNPFIDEDRWIGVVKILEEPDPKVLEITYHWNTRKGATQDEIRVPIPKGKLGEAVVLMSKLNSEK